MIWHIQLIKKNGDPMIKQLLNLVIAKYRDLSVSRRSIICLSLRLRQIIDLLATDKSRYFAEPRPIIVYYFTICYGLLCRLQDQLGLVVWRHCDSPDSLAMFKRIYWKQNTQKTYTPRSSFNKRTTSCTTQILNKCCERQRYIALRDHESKKQSVQLGIQYLFTLIKYYKVWKK